MEEIRRAIFRAPKQTLYAIVAAVFFWVPLAVAGFDPAMILLQQYASLTYQGFVHTRAIGRLGPLEWVFNTPCTSLIRLILGRT